MVSLKKLVQMAMKWQRMTKVVSYNDNDQCSTSLMAEKGHFVMYSIDGKRFMVPLVYLSSRIVEQLFKLSEEEFGFTIDGPITLPCNGAFMEYVIDLIKKGVSEEVESALLCSLSLPCSSVSCAVQKAIEICSF